jgi:hypothetical protein
MSFAGIGSNSRNGGQQGTDDETGCRKFDFHGVSFALGGG